MRFVYFSEFDRKSCTKLMWPTESMFECICSARVEVVIWHEMRYTRNVYNGKSHINIYTEGMCYHNRFIERTVKTLYYVDIRIKMQEKHKASSINVFTRL